MNEEFSQPFVLQGKSVHNIGVEYFREGGLITYWDGKLPRRGFFPDQRIMDRLDACKSLIMLLVKMITITPLKYFLIIPKLRAEIIRTLASILHKTLHRYYLTDDMWCEPVRELNKIVFHNVPPLYDMAFQRLKNVFLSFVEYDSAYKYRLQWLFGELSKDALSDAPKQEILRVLALCEGREGEESVKAKWRLLSRIIRLTPTKYLKILAEALKPLDFERIKLDRNDRDWIKEIRFNFD